MMVSFVTQKLLSSRGLYLLNVALSNYDNDSLFSKSSYTNNFKAISYFLFCQIQCILLYASSLIYVNLSFVKTNKYGSIWMHLHATIQLKQHHFLKMLSFFFSVYFWLLKITGANKCVNLYPSLQLILSPVNLFPMRLIIL